MPKGRGKKKGKKPRRFNSSLGQHRQERKILTPPMMQIPDLRMTSWPHDGLPECIWIAAVSKETHRRAAAHGPLDVLEPFVFAETPEVLDGRISRFDLIPPDRRADARAALRERAPYGLPHELGHAIAQYPDCPALWLYEDWIAENECDQNRGVEYLSEIVGPMIPSRDSHSAELRLMVIARHAKAGKLHFTEDIETADLLHKYPTYLDRDDRAKVESFVRACWNSFHNINDGGTVAKPAWCQYFWHRSFEISPCLPFDPDLDSENLGEFDEERELPQQEGSGGVPEKQTSLADLRNAFSIAVRNMGDELRQLQSDAVLDTFSPEQEEVKLGLASRAFRLLRRFLLTPSWWTNEMAPHLIRSLVDERIVVAWLLKKDDPELFRAYKEYGAGKRKLYKLKLEELMDTDDQDDEETDVSKLHERLGAEVNQDTMEEFLKIDLGGTFSGKNIRQMAMETDLADLYSLSYQPLSTESHGKWGSLIMFDLDHCGNPLHLSHRLGSFDVDDRGYIHSGWARTATNLAEDIVIEIFASIGLDAQPTFDRFHECIETRVTETSTHTGGS